jgi:hypothetical protein
MAAIEATGDGSPEALKAGVPVAAQVLLAPTGATTDAVPVNATAPSAAPTVGGGDIVLPPLSPTTYPSVQGLGANGESADLDYADPLTGGVWLGM